MKKFILSLFCFLLIAPNFAFGFVQNGTYYEIDYGDNYYLTSETTITIPPYRGGGRVDLSGIEAELETIRDQLAALNLSAGNETSIEELKEIIEREIIEKLNTTNEQLIAEIEKKITQLFVEKKAPYFTTLSQPINLELYPKEYTQTFVMIKNTRNGTSRIRSRISGTVTEFINIENPVLTLNPGEEGYVNLSIYVLPEASPGPYYGNLVMETQDNISSLLPINIRVLQAREKLLDIKIAPVREVVTPGETLGVQTTLYNLGGAAKIEVNLIIQLIDTETNNPVLEETQKVEVETTRSTITELNLSMDIKEGRYIIRGIAQFTREGTQAQEIAIAYVTIQKSFFQLTIYGVPVWGLLIFIILALTVYTTYVLYEREQAKKRRYLETLELRTLPQPGPRAGFIGRLAETAIRAFFDIDKLTTHVLVAGATGSGKTVAAEVLVEEALQRNIAVIVFDPTAQWTGFLRKNADKGMFKLYSKFGMKQKDAKAFNGNIHIVKDPNDRIDIRKYINPGEINVFCLHRLETPDIDTIVRNTIQDIFIGGFEETYELKVLIVFDEVHRLLPKFGGSGSGLTQVEHAVREFRKWGLGVILISQVLSDFVGEIKANVGTEIQLRTRYEEDLNRIKMKYGEDILKSVVKASVGTGMVQNAEYNKGRPYFVTFRPLLHNLQRLSDKQLDLYDKYNLKIGELRNKIEKLKEAKIDVFDLDLELNLALDNVKKGAFDVAKLYIESLEPRISSEYEKAFSGVKPIPTPPEKSMGKEVDDSRIIRKMQEKDKEVISRFKKLKKPERLKGGEEEKKVEKVEVEEPTRDIFPERKGEGGTDSEKLKLKEKVESVKGVKPPSSDETADLSTLGLKTVSSDETIERGPQIKKVISRKDHKIFVYLTIKNNQRTPLKNIQVIDPLPEDAENVDIITHENLSEQTEKQLKWTIPSLGMKEKRILHYTLNTKLERLPSAILKWSEKEDEWEDVKNVWKAIEEKKKLSSSREKGMEMKKEKGGEEEKSEERKQSQKRGAVSIEGAKEEKEE
jgi:hypothetical protein